MAETRPWLFTPLANLADETQLYTSRKDNQSAPQEFRFTVGQLRDYLAASGNIGKQKLLIKVHPINTETTTVTLDAAVPQDLADTFVLRSGNQKNLGTDFTLSGGVLTFNETLYASEVITTISLIDA